MGDQFPSERKNVDITWGHVSLVAHRYPNQVSFGLADYVGRVVAWILSHYKLLLLKRCLKTRKKKVE